MNQDRLVLVLFVILFFFAALGEVTRRESELALLRDRLEEARVMGAFMDRRVQLLERRARLPKFCSHEDSCGRCGGDSAPCEEGFRILREETVGTSGLSMTP